MCTLGQTSLTACPRSAAVSGLRARLNLPQRHREKLPQSQSDTIIPSYTIAFANEIRFLLVGKTGVGKSTTGNTILGSEKFVTSSGLHSETSKCEVHRSFILGVNVEVTDTPGLFDTKIGEAVIAKVIAQAVACMHPGPHVFLFLVKLGNRFTQEEAGTYRRLVAIFDEAVSKHMIVVFTGGDNLRPGQTINDLLEMAPSQLKEVLQASENRYVVFDNNAADKKPQVERLLQMAQKLIEKNDNQHYSCPKYFFIQEQMGKEIQKRMELVEKNEGRLKAYVKKLEEKNQELEKAREKLEEQERQYVKQLRENRENTERRMNELKREQEQQLLSSTEKETQQVNLLKAMEGITQELNKKHEKDILSLQEKELKANKEFEKTKKELEEAKQKLEWEERKKLKDRISNNEEKGLIPKLAGGISGAAGWAWKKLFGSSE